ncbi:MAG: hypothetical protein A2186_00130 [Candidatus Levybacteria bacterium RIFOXYA1_FULL_41_10]|nr:MAG: hypothetical protein A2695_00410 [Candidatus Levybacteria bacterium RIFCSPHIGHO2_01_FULL_40_83]OGH25575.1 MAG: hypothetical protein A3D82_03830 [Candidatus Levybacteria bacterium RIFCSPHIGHO2_02_FULL_40_29]OGH32812.1 MAG: hypothetical protein A3E70_00765 [Candidatus Levybacteria bacterium RIFCSPHIGHO2_12_FULL_40_44]OGH41661.1 MAG: hypothetical protein A2965_02945 [Candidatus Levybacteria bacterium RIFCSPLOWO2_01_FULL_40_96]OGH50056.1 MAG: hypothetical protein A3J18_03945 [Candidatus Lev
MMIVITGTIAFDYIMNFPGEFKDHVLPSQSHQINLSFIVNKFAKRRGGTAGNVSYSMGLLKTPHTLFSVAGSDFEEYRKKLEELGIDCSKVSIKEVEHSSTGFAMTDATNNQIWGYFYGASDHIKDLKLNSIAKRGDLILVGPSGAEGSMSFIDQCITQRIEYAFDPGFILTQVKNEDLAKGVKHAKYIFGNDYEIKLIKDRIKSSENEWKDKIVVTTLGEKGATVAAEGRTHKIKAAQPKALIDPTGAGDAFRAGFLAGLEKVLDLKTCGEMGSTAASFCLEEYGTQEHIFTKQEFEKRYRQTYGHMLKF